MVLSLAADQTPEEFFSPESFTVELMEYKKLTEDFLTDSNRVKYIKCHESFRFV